MQVFYQATGLARRATAEAVEPGQTTAAFAGSTFFEALAMMSW